MSLVVLILGGVPSLRVTTGAVSVSFTVFSLVTSHITLFLVVTDESSFSFVSSPLGVFSFGKSLPKLLYFLIKEFRFGANCSGAVGKGAESTVFSH